MRRQSNRPNQSDFNRALRAFAGQGLSPRIIYRTDGSIVIESSTLPLSQVALTNEELDNELKLFTEKHCEG